MLPILLQLNTGSYLLTKASNIPTSFPFSTVKNSHKWGYLMLFLEQQTKERKKRTMTQTEHSVALVPVTQQDMKDVSPIHGLNIPATWTFEEKLAMMEQVSELKDGKSDKIDEYLNRIIWVKGIVQHDVIVNNSNNTVNRSTGEVPQYIDAVRSVMLVVGVDAERFEAPEKVSVTSLAATRYFQQNIIPVFTPFFEQPIPLRFRVVQTGQGRTYSIQIVKGVKF